MKKKNPRGGVPTPPHYDEDETLFRPLLDHHDRGILTRVRKSAGADRRCLQGELSQVHHVDTVTSNGKVGPKLPL